MNDIKIGQIATTVVTFNRLELLKKTINSLRNQTRKIDQIIVINNSSNDGTLEWLNLQQDILTVTQENTGGSGGHYTGARLAFEMGFEWIWQMDDDVTVETDCLENLLKYSRENLICATIKITFENKIFYSDIKKINIANPFRSIWGKIIEPADFQNEVVPIEGFTLEGPIFHRNIIENIGFVRKDFFIYADDTEYAVRALKQNIKTIIVKSAILHRQLPFPLKNEYNFDWKTYYMIRNIIAIDTIHGNFVIRWIRPIGYFISWLSRCRKLSDLRTTIKAFIDGYTFK